MMLESVTYYTILGLPLIAYIGMVTLFFLLLTAAVSWMNRRGIKKICFKWHPRLAMLTIVIAIVHAFLGLLAYF